MPPAAVPSMSTQNSELRTQNLRSRRNPAIDRPDQIAQALDCVALAVIPDAVEQLRPYERVDEVRGADLDGIGAGDDELERIAGVGDAAHADHRDLHRLPALVHHADGDRPDRRTTQPADAVRDLWPARLDVDDHRQEGVDQ